MIKQATSDPARFEKIISASSFLAEKMRCEYYSAGDNAKGNFYFLNNCGIMVMGENVSVCGRYTAQELETILSFCHFMGIYGLESEQDNLPIHSRMVMNYMRHTGRADTQLDNVVKDTNLYSFSHFCADNFTGTDFDTVYSYFARKVNRGFSHIYYIEQNGKIVSAALSTNYGQHYYLTFVSTGREYRHSGYASRLIGYITAENKPRDTILMCENELVGFYQNLGFKKEKEIYLYKLREENI